MLSYALNGQMWLQDRFLLPRLVFSWTKFSTEDAKPPEHTLDTIVAVERRGQSSGQLMRCGRRRDVDYGINGAREALRIEKKKKSEFSENIMIAEWDWDMDTSVYMPSLLICI